MKYKVYKDAESIVRMIVDAESLEEATDYVWENAIRPSKWKCDNENVEVYDLPPFFINQWIDCKMVGKEKADIGFSCSFTLACETVANSEEEALKLIDACDIKLEEFEYLNSDEKPNAKALLIVGDIQSIIKE